MLSVLTLVPDHSERPDGSPRHGRRVPLLLLRHHQCVPVALSSPIPNPKLTRSPRLVPGQREVHARPARSLRNCPRGLASGHERHEAGRQMGGHAPTRGARHPREAQRGVCVCLSRCGCEKKKHVHTTMTVVWFL